MFKIMSNNCTYHTLRRAMKAWVICLGLMMPANIAFAQITAAKENLDPRLVEIIEIVRNRTTEKPTLDVNAPEPVTVDRAYLGLVDQLHKASLSNKSREILSAVESFRAVDQERGALSLNRLPELYTAYAALLNRGATSSEIQAALIDYTSEGNWFERYLALSLLSYIHGTGQERQAALQKAQLALSLIPMKPDPRNEEYIFYAKSRAISAIAHLHNLQGNSELALNASLEYLHLTEENSDSRVEVDLINNLIYSYSLARNHRAQLYLIQQLLEIEKTHSSSVAGLSEMRIAGVMNSDGLYEDGLDYARMSIKNASNPTVIRIARVNEAIALAGQGKLGQAREVANLADVNLDRTYMLNSETRQSALYLAFLLAQAEDSQYATQLYNRQLDVKAQKFYANNSRDTTAMLAELENTHERQAERETAAARESQLQALTIKRKSNLNRALTVLTVLMGLVMLAGFLFSRYRGRVLRKLEIKTREAASAEKLKSEFLGMISHELRTPLNGIIGISDFLANHHEDEEIRKKTGIVLSSGNELLSVVESLTDMARIDAGELKLVPHDADLGASLASIPDLWEQKARAKNLTFTAFVDPAITDHHVDEARILQCINILLSNAVSFTNSGRVHLHITASKTEPSTLTAIVADTGQGMSELVQSRLFTPFMQADAGRKRNHMGTGLSLAIAYALAEMMDGELSVLSREGRGSEFTLTLPLQPALNEITPAKLALNGLQDHEPVNREPAAPPSPAAVAAEINQPNPEQSSHELGDPVMTGPNAPKREYVDLMQPAPMQVGRLHHEETPVSTGLLTPRETSGANRRILIVDDIHSNREILRLILETQGFICGEAVDGLSALSALDKQAFDLVIMDVHMAPMDGVEALRCIRTSKSPHKDIPIIALTADDDPNINIEAIKAGASLFLTKPVRQADLFQHIEELLLSEPRLDFSRSA